MKKILIVIHDLQIGGAQKGLVNFLNCLDRSGRAAEYEIRLLALTASGPLLAEVPTWVKQIKPSRCLRWFSSHLSLALFRDYFCWRGLFGEAYWIIRKCMKISHKRMSKSQKMWECWKHFIPDDSEEYDVAVSYLDGGTNYYVMDRVNAKKKILWVHSEYQKQGYVPEYDRHYYEACDGVITISEQCRQCILRAFPQLHEKVHVLENITSYDFVLKQSREDFQTEFPDTDVLKLLSVGRLHEQKGFDLAVEAAALLKKKGVPFIWLVVGEGSERSKLQKMIDEYELHEQFLLIGARDNPYVYMKECTILVQPSRVEGKSIVLDEAKMLCKPIIATNYATVKDAIEHGETGWITDIHSQGIMEAIIRLWKDNGLCEYISSNLQKQEKGNETELYKYLETMFS